LADYSDKELLSLFRESDNRNYAFNLLVRKHQHKIYWLVRRLVIDHDDADDVVQETFIKIWNGLQGFKGDSSLYTWMYRIAVNESLSFLKRKSRRFILPLVDAEKQLRSLVDQDPRLSGDEIQKKLQKAILHLPQKQRLVFHMKYYDEMTYEEMSEVLKTSVGALKASYHHAVKKIETFFTED
jgi:RNA polymerase sigma factor (sigma-70 family)